MEFIAFIFSLIKRLVTGTETTYTYNNAGRQTASTAAYGSAVSTTSYSILDKASRVITSYTGSATYATGYTYNNRGQVLTTTDAEGRTTTNAYDISGRLTSTTDALGNVVSYGYNVEDLMTSLTYTKGGSSVPTIYTYNDQHRLVRTDQPGYNIASPTTTITNTSYTGYDANGNVTSRTDGAGVNIQYTFDNINRMYRKTYPDATTADFGFDAASNTLTISDTNTSTANEFDALNRLTKTTNYMYTTAKIFQYTYYNDGVRKTMTDPTGFTTSYTYDKAKRLKTLSFTGFPSAVASYDYNALGLRTKETLVNGATVTYTYNSTTRWLTGVYNSTSTPTSISTFTYTHDKVGNRVTMAEYNGGSSIAVTYTYGALYRVLTETMQSGMMWQQKGYIYDAPGNRTMMTVDNGMITSYTYYTYNNANQCVSWTDSSGVGFVDKYDGAGNLITETNTATGVMQEWRYDYENHQTVYSTTGTSATYKIDAMGRRISKTNNQQQTTENYLYDGANVLLDLDSAGNFQKIYLMSGLDEPVCFINSQMSMYYYMQDGLGSVCNLIDQQQTTKNCYIYSAFGELLVDSEMVPQRYKFTGREWDSESSTYNYRPRQMRPSWGRFLRRDPIGYVAGINLYTYVRNNPVNMRDSFGLFPSGEEMVQGISTPLRRIARLEVGSTLGSPRYAALYHTAVALTKEFGDRMFKTLGYEVMFSSLGQGIQGFGGSKLFQTFASSFLSGVKEYAISEDTRSAILAAIQDIAETGQGELTGAPMTFDTPLEEVLEKLQGEGKLTTYACSTREGGHCWGIDLFAVINTDYASMEIINKSKDIRRGKASAFVTGDLPKGGYSTIHDAEAFPLQKSIRFSFVVTWDVDINYNWSPFVTDSLEKTSNVEVKDEDFKYIEYRE